MKHSLIPIYLVFLITSACVSSNKIISNSGDSLFVSEPDNWHYYVDSSAKNQTWPVTILPNEKISSDELTSSITFYATKNQIAYFPTEIGNFKVVHIKNGELNYIASKNDQATYFLAKLSFQGREIYSLLTVSSNSQYVVDERKRQYFRMLEDIINS